MTPANPDLRARPVEVEKINELHRIQGIIPWDKDKGRVDFQLEYFESFDFEPRGA